MDIREFAPKQLPYHFVLFYGMNDSDLIVYKQLLGGNRYDNALLTYCYIDRMAGISYDVICCAYLDLDNETITYHSSQDKKAAMKLREGSLICHAAIMDTDPGVKQFESYAEKIKQNYGYFEDKVAINPNIPFDDFRHPDYPDDIFVSFFDSDGREERMWVHVIGNDRGIVEAELLNAPYNERLGLNKGDKIKIEAYRDPRQGKGPVQPIWRA